MNWPNAITVARVLLVPVFVVLAYGDSDAAVIGSLVVFGIASLSDFVDGYLARRWEITSAFGEWADPLADKLLVGAALVVLVDLREFPLWVALVIAVREVVVQILRAVIVKRGGALPASPAAKLKTLLQIGMVGWWLAPWEGVSAIHWIWLGAVLLATLWSGTDYVLGYARMKEARA
jgi:CDP-diacylglycerol--glycerol-3-phosphate 3-phosphatidyltransferase